jgi:hypothetical protein
MLVNLIFSLQILTVLFAVLIEKACELLKKESFLTLKSAKCFCKTRRKNVFLKFTSCKW